ncbi:mitochondrial uncharacterized protein, partial [Leptotrombidium deliense]
MNRFAKLFPKCLKSKTSIIGMIHVRSLPGTPLHKLTVQELIDKACEEALMYKKYNFDGVIVENMHDVPYVCSKDSGPEVLSVMTA